MSKPVFLPIKIQFNFTIRRTKLSMEPGSPVASPYARLLATVTSLFPDVGDNFVIKFPDDEDEFCIVTSDVELLEAVNVMAQLGRPSLKLCVYRSNSPRSRSLITDVVIEEPLLEVKHVEPEDEPDVSKEPLPETKQASEPQDQPQDQPQNKSQNQPQDQPQDKPVQDVKHASEPQIESVLDVKHAPEPEIKLATEPQNYPSFPQEPLSGDAKYDVQSHTPLEHKDYAPVHLNRHIMLSALLAPMMQNIGRNMSEGWAKTLHTMQQHMGKAQVHVEQAWQGINHQMGQAGQDVQVHAGRAQQHLGQALHGMQLQLRTTHQQMGSSVLKMHQDMQQAHDHIRQALQDVKLGHAMQKHMVQARQSMQQAWQHLALLSESKHATHAGIQCAGCHQGPITGVRFKCAVCPDFNLCAGCEAKDMHPMEHPLLKMRVPARTDVHHGFACDSCGVGPITGPRYTCTECNCNLCQACEAKDEHPANHVLLKIRVAIQHAQHQTPALAQAQVQPQQQAQLQQQEQVHQLQAQQPSPSQQLQMPLPICIADVEIKQPAPQQVAQSCSREIKQESVGEPEPAPEPARLPQLSQTPPRAPVTKKSATPPPPPVTPYFVQLHDLCNMGFTDEQCNLTLLQRFNGDMLKTCHALLDM